MTKKTLLTFTLSLQSLVIFGQVGVNTTNPQGVFNIDGGKDNPTTGSGHTPAQQLNDYVVTSAGNVGIGTISPSQKLEIQTGGTAASPVTGFKLVDGGEGNDYVLTSDVNGVGTWKPARTVSIIRGINGATGIDVFFTDSNDFKYTGSYIDLPPGKFQISIYQLMYPYGTPLTADQYILLRTTFSDTPGLNVGDIATMSPDLNQNPTLVSFMVQGPTSAITARMQVLNGLLLINNTSGSTKRYYYIAGLPIIGGTPTSSSWLGSVGGNWSENYFYAQRVGN